LYTWLSPYLLDNQEFCPSSNAKIKMTIGEYVENLLRDYDYYHTRLPRIPVQIERDLKMKLMEIPEKRQRKRDNERKVFAKGMKVKAISAQDGEWHEGIIVEVMRQKMCIIQFVEGSKEISDEKTDNKWFNHEMFLLKANHIKKEKKEEIFFAGEEIVDLGNIVLSEEETAEIEDKNYSNEKRGKSRSQSKKRKKRERSRSKKKKKHSRSRSRERTGQKEQGYDSIMEKIKMQEREAAVAKGKDYAVRPSSYKSSLSQAVANKYRKRSKSPELRQNIEIIHRKRSPSPKGDQKHSHSSEYMSYQQKLKEKYGQPQSGSYATDGNKKKDLITPDIVKLGKK